MKKWFIPVTLAAFLVAHNLSAENSTMKAKNSPENNPAACAVDGATALVGG